MQSVTTLSHTAKKEVSESLNKIRQHPFLCAASNQDLTEEQIARWLMCAGRESRSFPNILRNMIERCSNNKGASHKRIIDILSQNLQDELGNGNIEEAHFKHYLKLLDKLDIPIERFHNYQERAGIRLALDIAYNVSVQENEAIAVGYMLVNESITPVTNAAIQKALTKYRPPSTIAFFNVHVDIDIKHVEALYRAVEELEARQIDDLIYGISVGERGMSALFDEAYGLFEHLPVTSHAN
jgi:pyrroloquinoline quinone (PQQ) biosynthesis protein C